MTRIVCIVKGVEIFIGINMVGHVYQNIGNRRRGVGVVIRVGVRILTGWAHVCGGIL